MKRPFKAIIEDVITQPDKIQPIILNFQIGELNNEAAKNMSCGLFHDQKKNKTVLGLSNGNTVYKGYRPDVTKDATRTMLVLHNKKTGKIRLFEAERWQVAPVLEKPVIEDSKKDTTEMIRELTKQFGSKKQKRKSEIFEMINKVDIESEQLETSVSNVKIDRLDLSIQSQSISEESIATLLPNCNRDASNVKDVYNVYDIIPKSKLETLYEQAMEVADGAVKGKSKFFKHILEAIQSDPDKINKIALLLYIEFINKWFSMPLKEVKKRDVVVCSISEEVNQHIIDTYSVSNSTGRFYRPHSLKDKGLIHCLILALTISNFSLDLDLFQHIWEMRTSLKKLLELARIVGATPSKDDKKIVTLKIPLPQPKSIVRRGKKSGKGLYNSITK